MKLNPNDFVIDTFRIGTFTVRITHIPTGKSATAEHKSEYQAKGMAMKTLKELLNEDSKRA